MSENTGRSTEPSSARTFAAGLLLFVVAAVAHLRLVDTWWLHDDWVFLADAAGLADRGGAQARWLSYQFYWDVFFPLFGLNPVGWGITRLVLHFFSSVLVTRLGRLAGCGRSAALIAGIVFAASPVAFDSLYWGTGAVELLGTFWALWSLERWFSGGAVNRWIALGLAGLAIASKETGLFLPLFFAAHLAVERTRRWTLWGGLSLLFALGAYSTVQIRSDVAPLSEYALSLGDAPRNLLALGFWLVAPPPWQMGLEWMRPWALWTGAGVWFVWVASAIVSYRSGSRIVALILSLTVLSLGPATLVGSHILPRYAYAGVAGLAICIGLLVRARKFSIPPGATVAVAVVATGLAWYSTNFVLNARHDGGRPVHRLVLKEELSKTTCNGIEKLKQHEFDHLVFYVDPEGDRKSADILKDALGGELGPRLILGKDVQVEWLDELGPEQAGALIVEVRGINLRTLGYYEPR